MIGTAFAARLSVTLRLTIPLPTIHRTGLFVRPKPHARGTVEESMAQKAG